MKLFVRSLVAIIVLLLPLLALYRWQADMAVPSARPAVGSLSGLASIQHQGMNSALTVSQDALYVGDIVQALNNVRVTLNEGTVLTLQPGAVITVRDAGGVDGGITIFQQAGRVSVDTINPLFRLEADTLTLAMDRTRFHVDVTETGDAFVQAERGLVYGKSEGDDVALADGESMRTGVGRRAQRESSTPFVVPPPPPAPLRTPTPTITPVPPTQPPQRVHIITHGDTLTYLANLYNVTVDAIVKANNIEDPNFLLIGQKLIIPPPK